MLRKFANVCKIAHISQISFAKRFRLNLCNVLSKSSNRKTEEDGPFQTSDFSQKRSIFLLSGNRAGFSMYRFMLCFMCNKTSNLYDRGFKSSIIFYKKKGNNIKWS